MTSLNIFDTPSACDRVVHIGSMKDKKQQIINAAIQSFSRHGYRATTIRQVAKKAGITAGSLYNHIRSKEELLLEIQTKFIDEMINRMKNCRSKASAKEKIEDTVSIIMETIARNRLAWKILIDEFNHFPAAQQKKIRIKGDEFENLITEFIEEGEQAGEFETPNTKMATFFLLGACHHSSKWINPRGGIPAKEIGRQFAAFFLQGLCKRPHKQF